VKVSKLISINIGQYESLKLGVEDASCYDDADAVIISELKRIDIPVSNKIKQCIQWKEKNNL
jgi:hypothetical protein